MEKLYYTSPYTKEFEALVVSCGEGKKGVYEIELDRTAFYPQGGGQPGDVGLLNQTRVLDTHERDGRIVHYAEEPVQPGTRVNGILNWERRFIHMQQHTGEHILSGLIHQKLGWDNVGFHMGGEEVTVDFNGLITEEQLRALEEEANRVVYENIPVLAFYPDREALDKLDYRSKKELNGQVRIVEIPGADVCACCGTHVERTGEVGIIKCTGMIHYKGGVRITMECGWMALWDYGRKQDQVIRISNLLSAKQNETAEAVEKLKGEAAEKDGRLIQLFRQLMELKAGAYPPSDKPLLVFEEGLTPVMIRQYCTLLYEQEKGSVVMVCSGRDGCYQFALGSAGQDMRALGREVNARLDGRGGGSARMVQGTLKAARGMIEEIISSL